jgi:hypothetical protein
MIFVTILNILDMIGGFSLVFDVRFLLYPLGLFHLLKGGWTIYSSFVQGFPFEVLGGIDFMGGIAMLLLNWHLSSTYFLLLGIAMVAKGVFCFMVR